MMNKKFFFTSLFISCLLLFSSQSYAVNLMESFFLKVTVVENGIEHQWEYTSPGKYEYETGEKVKKSQEAKDEMLKIVKMLKLSEKVKVEEMVERLKQETFPQLESLDIRWMTGDNQLYTWVWEQTKQK